MRLIRYSSRLARDVRGRETQAQIAGVARVGHLRQHLTVAIGIEPVRLDPPKAGDAFELHHRLLQQILKACGQLQATDEVAHQWVVVALPGQLRWQARGFELGNQYFVVTVGQQVQRLTVGRALAQAHVADVKGENFIFGQPCEVRVQVETVADQIGEGATDQLLGRQAQPVLDVFTGLQHAQVGGVQYQQKAMRLDAARQVDRFLGTALHGVCQRVVCSHR